MPDEDWGSLSKVPRNLEGDVGRWHVTGVTRPGSAPAMRSTRPLSADREVLDWEHTVTLQPVKFEPRWFRGYLLATTVLFFGFGILGFIVTLGFDDSMGASSPGR